MNRATLRVILWVLVCGLAFALASCAGKAETITPVAKTGGVGPADTAPKPAEPAAAREAGSADAAGGEGPVPDSKTESATASAFAEDGGSTDYDVGNGADYDEGKGGLDFEELAPPSPADAPAAASVDGGPDSRIYERVEERTAGRRPAASPGLKAGFADDNKQFNYFTGFLKEYAAGVAHIAIPVDERIILRVQDGAGKSLPNASVEVHGGGRLLCRGTTYADGSFLFFPAQHDRDQPGKETAYRAVVTHNQARREVSFQRTGLREVPVRFDAPRPAYSDVPLDILFVLDTTGSMGEEIARLKTTIELIKLNLSALPSRPKVRFGMVLYRDRGDEYDTQPVPFTDDLERFQQALDAVEADGGGDDPEDLQAALQEALKMSWSRGGIRLAFIITDAAPHLDYGQTYTYAQAVQDAREKGIKIYSVGTGGLDLAGEYVLRQISQYTAARYIFLTYGEEGESEGGAPGSVSHHTGANWQTDKLEAIIIRFAKEELAFISDQPLEGEEEYFQAVRTGEEAQEETLRKLFTMAVAQLVDYSTYRIPPATPASVLPLAPAAQDLAASAEYFTEQLALSFTREEAFRKSRLSAGPAFRRPPHRPNGRIDQMGGGRYGG